MKPQEDFLILHCIHIIIVIIGPMIIIIITILIIINFFLLLTDEYSEAPQEVQVRF